MRNAIVRNKRNACQVANMSYIIAHRGASFDAPENTLAAFRLAWAQGADGIEGDFMLTADGRVVCFHDVDARRTAGEPWVVKETSLAKLATLDVGRWKGERWHGERIATLEDVLAVVPAGKRFVIELKDGPEIVEPVARILADAEIPAERLLIISLVDATIAECRKVLPNVTWHWLSGYEQDRHGDWRPAAEEVIASIQKLGAAGFGSLAKPDHFDAEFVEQLRAAGIDQFHVWTVDDPDVARFYQKLGAWGITTNRPAFIRAALSS